jgi:TrpR-related protein YerC/YecD
MPEDRLRTPGVDDLLDALLALEARDEAYALLLDLCTIREIHDMAQRLHVARMLASGEHYARIQEVTGASATTISRVSKCLNYGADGYRTVLERLWPDDSVGKAPGSRPSEPPAGPRTRRAGA